MTDAGLCQVNLKHHSTLKWEDQSDCSISISNLIGPLSKCSPPTFKMAAPT